MLLKKLLNQEIPDGTTLACIGKPGSGKTLLCIKLAYEYTQRKKNVVYLTTENTPTRLLSLHEHLGIRFDIANDLQYLRFIDAHSWKVGAKGEGLSTTMISNPGNFSEVSLAINSASKDLPEGTLVIIDSLSGLMLGAPDETRIKNFFHVLSQRLNQKGYTLIAIVEDGCHDPKLTLGLRALAHSSLLMRVTEDGMGMMNREIRIAELLGCDVNTKWHRIRVTDTGPEIGG